MIIILLLVTLVSCASNEIPLALNNNQYEQIANHNKSELDERFSNDRYVQKCLNSFFYRREIYKNAESLLSVRCPNLSQIESKQMSNEISKTIFISSLYSNELLELTLLNGKFYATKLSKNIIDHDTLKRINYLDNYVGSPEYISKIKAPYLNKFSPCIDVQILEILTMSGVYCAKSSLSERTENLKASFKDNCNKSNEKCNQLFNIAIDEIKRIEEKLIQNFPFSDI